MYKTEIARQIVVEIIELMDRIEESSQKAQPKFIVKMYEKFLLQKQFELKNVGDA